MDPEDKFFDDDPAPEVEEKPALEDDHATLEVGSKPFGTFSIPKGGGALHKDGMDESVQFAMDKGVAEMQAVEKALQEFGKQVEGLAVSSYIVGAFDKLVGHCKMLLKVIDGEFNAGGSLPPHVIGGYVELQSRVLTDLYNKYRKEKK